MCVEWGGYTWTQNTTEEGLICGHRIPLGGGKWLFKKAVRRQKLSPLLWYVLKNHTPSCGGLLVTPHVMPCLASRQFLLYGHTSNCLPLLLNHYIRGISHPNCPFSCLGFFFVNISIEWFSEHTNSKHQDQTEPQNHLLQ